MRDNRQLDRYDWEQEITLGLEDDISLVFNEVSGVLNIRASRNDFMAMVEAMLEQDAELQHEICQYAIRVFSK